MSIQRKVRHYLVSHNFRNKRGDTGFGIDGISITGPCPWSQENYDAVVKLIKEKASLEAVVIVNILEHQA